MNVVGKVSNSYKFICLYSPSKTIFCLNMKLQPFNLLKSLFVANKFVLPSLVYHPPWNGREVYL